MTAAAGHSALLVGADAVMRGLGCKGSPRAGCDEERLPPDVAMGVGACFMERICALFATTIAVVTVCPLIVGVTLSMAFLSARTHVFSKRMT